MQNLNLTLNPILLLG